MSHALPPFTPAARSLPDIPAPFPSSSLLPFAEPLLLLLARLRTLSAEADPAALRDRAADALRRFEERALAAGFAPDLVRRGHYALCESLDTAILNTPWGAGSPWSRQLLVATFHPQVGSGRFADALRAAEARPAELAPVLELMLLCLSLGVPDEPARQRAAAVLSADDPAPGTLSPHWEGVVAPFQPRRRPRLPLWVAAAAALLAAASLFVWLRAGVDARGDALFTAMLDAPPAHMPAIAREPAPPLPPPPPAAVPTARDRVAARLGTLPATITLAGTPGAPIIRLADAALFATDRATLLPAAAPPLERVAAALRPEGGAVSVIGYTDDRPVHTVAVASAFKLTASRADAVRAALAKLLPGTPVTAEGRGGADPVAPNDSEAGREQNRRVEVVLDRAPP